MTTLLHAADGSGGHRSAPPVIDTLAELEVILSATRPVYVRSQGPRHDAGKCVHLATGEARIRPCEHS